MTSRIALVAALVAGCQSVALQTRVSAGGGEYTLFPAAAQSIPGTVRDALAGISDKCSGLYEVTSLGLLSETSNNPIYRPYLGLDGQVQFGPFFTVVAYECRPPASTALNDRLAAIAASAGKASASSEDEQCLVTYDCPVGRVCAPTAEACKGL